MRARLRKHKEEKKEKKNKKELEKKGKSSSSSFNESIPSTDPSKASSSSISARPSPTSVTASTSSSTLFPSSSSASRTSTASLPNTSTSSLLPSTSGSRQRSDTDAAVFQPLLEAVRSGSLPLFTRQIIGHPPMVRNNLMCMKSTTDHQSLLHIAAAQDYSFFIDPFFQLSAGLLDINAVDINGRTALHVAALNDALTTFRLLLDRYPNTDAKDVEAKTALHYLASSSIPPQNPKLLREIISILADLGASFNEVDKRGNTPLHLAAQHAPVGMIELLCRFGVSESSLRLLNEEQLSPLHIACAQNRIEVAGVLIAYGSNINLPSPLGTPLQMASRLGFNELTQMFQSNSTFKTKQLNPRRFVASEYHTLHGSSAVLESSSSSQDLPNILSKSLSSGIDEKSSKFATNQSLFKDVLFAGEKTLHYVPEVGSRFLHSAFTTVLLLITQFRVICFVPTSPPKLLHAVYLGAIIKITESSDTGLSSNAPLVVCLECRDFRNLYLQMPSTDKSTIASLKKLINLKFSKHHPALSFASALAIDGSKTFSPEAEFYQRMKVPSDKWELFTGNQKFKWIPKYPKQFLVPSGFSELKALGNFRVECKIPVLTWARGGRSCLLRAAYPFDSFLVPGGSLKVDSTCDSVFYNQLRNNTLCKAIRIFSADSTRGLDTSIPADRIFFENFNFCTNEALVSSFLNFRKAIFEFPGHNPTSWYATIDKSLWLQNIAEVYRAAKSVFDSLLSGESVVFQSSTGDHPLPQVLSIVQVLLDAHYRTLAGFCTLIEKEWIVMGHQFYERNSKSYAAVYFLQFLDCLWQIMRQLPQTFEFTPDLLIFLLDEVYAERFGSFLLSSEKEREAEKLSSKSVSIWPWIFQHANLFKNSNYSKLENPICPPCERVRIWSSYYLRYIGETFQAEAAKQIVQCNTSTIKLSCVWDIPDTGINPQIQSFLAPQNYISSLSTSLANFPSLTMLDLSSNFLSVIPRSIAQVLTQGLPHLRQLRLARNDLTFFPAAFTLFSNLANLDVSNNALANVSVLSSLQRLEILKASRNQIKALPLDLHALQSLNKLVLQDNLLTELPESISSLGNLNSLQLDHNPLVMLPPTLPPRLTMLSLSFTQLPCIPDALYSARSLKHLNLRGLTERAIGPIFNHQISLLMNLQWLDLSHNHLRSEDLDANVFNLTNLEYLLIESNELSSLPPNFQNLTRLKHLALASNLLTELPPCISGFSTLSNLSLSRNQIRTLPPGLALLPSLSHLEYRDNPLRDPPREVVEKGSNAIFSYMKSILNGSEKVYRLKLMVVGQENVGKTSLIHCLRHRSKLPKSIREAQNISTDGINVQDIPLSIPVDAQGDPIKDPELARTANRVDVKLSVWDFAGQEVYYNTHQFFLSDRSIFVLVWNLTLPPENSRLEHWLHSLHLYAPNSPVLIVGTCADKIPDFNEEMEKHMLQGVLLRYRERFPNLLQCCAISAITGKGLEYFFGLLEWVAVRRPQMGELIPISYLLLEEYLKQERSNLIPPTLDWRQFSGIAKLSGISCETDIISSATLLHQLGSIIFFESDPELRDLIIVDPQWLMDVFKTIITTKHSWCRSGVLEHLALSQIWRPPAYPQYLHARLLKILQQFGILYFLPTSVPNMQLSTDIGISLVPAMLPIAPPESYHQWMAAASDADYHNRFEFDFVPPGFFARLLTRLLLQVAKLYPNDLLAQTEKVVWATGLIIEADLESACIVQDGNAINLSFRHANQEAFPTHLLNVVTLTLDVLVRGWLPSSAKVKRLVPFVSSRAPASVSRQAIPVESLQQALSQHQRFWFLNDVWPIPLARLEPIQSLAVVPKVPYSALEFGRELGVGGFGKVYKGRYQGKIVAIKELLTIGDTDHMALYKDLQQEAWNMICNSHPNIVSCLGICLGPPFCMVVEFMPYGDLYGFLHKPTNALPYPLAVRIAFDISLGLRFLHSNYPPVVHRDFKSPNVLLCSLDPRASVCAKVADLGISTGFTLSLKDKLDASVWLAPEVFLGLEYDQSSDIYSLAIVIWELLTRLHPYADYPGYSFEDGIIEGYRPTIPPETDARLSKLIAEGWDGNPRARPSIFTFVEGLRQIATELHIHQRKKSRPVLVHRGSVETNTKRTKLHTARLRALSAGNRLRFLTSLSELHEQPVLLDGSPAKCSSIPLSLDMASCRFQTTIAYPTELATAHNMMLQLPSAPDDVRSIQHSYLAGQSFSTFEILGTIPDAPASPILDGGVPEHDFLIRLKWEPPEKDGGESVTEYRLERIDPQGNRREMYSGPNVSTTVGKPPLNSGTWSFRVSACNSRGWSAPSLPLIFSASTNVPEIPPRVVARVVDGTSILLQWDQPVYHYSPLLRYAVVAAQGEFSVMSPHFKEVYGTTDQEASSVASQSTWKTTIGGLLPNTAYSFAVRATNEVGDSKFSVPIVCRTSDGESQDALQVEAWRSSSVREYTRAHDPIVTSFLMTRFPNGTSIMILADGLQCGDAAARTMAIEAVRVAASKFSPSRLTHLRTVGDQIALVNEAFSAAFPSQGRLHMCIIMTCPISARTISIIAVRNAGSQCLPYLKRSDSHCKILTPLFPAYTSNATEHQTCSIKCSSDDFVLLISPGIRKNLDPVSLKIDPSLLSLAQHSLFSYASSPPSSSSPSSSSSSTSSNPELDNASGITMDSQIEGYTEGLLADLLDDGQALTAPLIVESISNFAYQVSHDLRHYLEAIQSSFVDVNSYPKPKNIDRGRRAHCVVLCCSTHL